jgi:hypothetical protein
MTAMNFRPSMQRSLRSFSLEFGAELHHEAKEIGEEPTLRDLSMFNRQQVEAGPLHVVPSRGDAFKLPSMRSLYGVPDTHFVPLGDDLIDRYVKIRKGNQMSRHASFQAITPNSLAIDGKLFREELIDHGKLLPVEAFFYPPMSQGLVLFVDAFRPFDRLPLTTGNDC